MQAISINRAMSRISEIMYMSVKLRLRKFLWLFCEEFLGKYILVTYKLCTKSTIWKKTIKEQNLWTWKHVRKVTGDDVIPWDRLQWRCRRWRRPIQQVVGKSRVRIKDWCVVSHNREKAPTQKEIYPLYRTHRSPFVSYGKHMINYLKSTIMLYQRDKRFSIENLLRKSQAKVWIATHQHVHHRISKSIKKMTEAIEKENTRNQRKI